MDLGPITASGSVIYLVCAALTTSSTQNSDHLREWGRCTRMIDFSLDRQHEC